MNENNNNVNLFKDYFLPCILGLLLGLFINQFFSLTTVNGLSMFPHLNNNDLLIMNKIPKYTNDINRGDIIIFNATPNDTRDKLYFIKRVIGIEGDHVVIENGDVILNNKVLDEPYLSKIQTTGEVDLIVPDDSYFVLGDNRDASSDSRIFGTIKHKDTVGVAFFRLFPLNKFNI